MIITPAWSVFLIRPPRERGDEYKISCYDPFYIYGMCRRVLFDVVVLISYGMKFIFCVHLYSIVGGVPIVFPD